MTETLNTRRSAWPFAAAVLIVAAGALFFRTYELNLKPFHGDEANQAFKAGVLLDTGVYRYDPIEHHGPTIYYLSLPLAWVTGASKFSDTTESTFRLVPALFGAALVILVLPLRKALGARAVFAAAVLTAISPAMVFYSRYFIQEMLLVFFAFGAIVAAWKYMEKPGWIPAILGGLCIGLAHASKETCILAFASYAGAFACVGVWSRLRDGDFQAVKSVKRIKPAHAVALALSAAIISIIFFSSFFTYGRGVIDSVLTYSNYTHKAGNFRIHDKPWYYYLSMLAFTKHAPYPWFSEGLILALGALGISVSLVKKRTENTPAIHLLRFIAFYTLGMTAAYSVIPYKTPWCALNFLQPMIVMAGVGADWLVRAARWRAIKAGVALLLALLAWQLGAQAYRANFVYYADPRNPYVYAHTSGAFTQLADRLEGVATTSPDGHNMLVAVASATGDYWPLPFYLRKFPETGYWNELPGDANAPIYSAPIIIASPQIAAEIQPKLKGEYHSEMHSLRPRVFLTVYIRTELWDAYMATRQGTATP